MKIEKNTSTKNNKNKPNKESKSYDEITENDGKIYSLLDKFKFLESERDEAQEEADYSDTVQDELKAMNKVDRLEKKRKPFKKNL